MKKILTILCIVLSFAAAAQPGYTRFNTRGSWLGVAADAFNLPGLGTPALITGQMPRAGAMVYDSTGGNRGVHIWTGVGWVKLYDTLMSVGVTIDTANKWVNNITKNTAGDSIIYYINTTRYAVKDLTGGGSDSSTFATQNDISLARNCPVIIDTIATAKLIDGIANDMHNAYHSLLFTKPNKTVWLGLREGKSHVYGGIPVLYSSTDYGVSFSDSIHVESDTANNYRGLHLYQKPGSDTIAMAYTSLRNNMGAIDSCVIYVRYSVNNLTTYTSRYRLMTGDNYSFNEDGFIYFKGKWVLPFYSFSPATNSAGVMTKTSITSGSGWTRSNFPNSTALELNEVQLFTNRTEDSLIALCRSETNQSILYRTASIDGVTWSTPTVVELEYWFAGRPSILKIPDGRIVMSYRSRETPPITPDDGRLAISENDGMSFTVVRQLVPVYYEYGDFLHLGDQDYLHVYSTQVVSTDYKADLYREFLRIPNCGFQGLESKSVEKPGSPIWNYYINRQVQAGLVTAIGLPDGAIGFGNSAGTAIISDATKLYYDNTLDKLSVGLATGNGRLTLKQIGSNADQGLLIEQNTNAAKAAMSMTADVFTIATSSNAAPTTFTARFIARAPTVAGTDEVVNINSMLTMLHDGTVRVNGTSGFRQYGNGIFRIENVGLTLPTGSLGIGHQFYNAGGISYWNTYNATTAANSPASILTSQLTITGPTQTQALVVQNGYPFMVGINSSDLSSPANGWIFYNTTTNTFRFRENGAWTELGSGGSTASNLGGGLANYSTAVGSDLRFNSFFANDFDLGSNLISIDYANGQKASATVPGFLSVGAQIISTDKTFAAPMNVKGAGGSFLQGFQIIGASDVATTSMIHSGGSFFIGLATAASGADATGDFTQRVRIYEPTATGTNPILQLGDNDLTIYHDGTANYAGNFGLNTATATHALTVNGQVRINAINNASTFDSVVVINNGVLEARLASTLVTSGGGSSVFSDLTAATATNTINNATFAQELQWNTLAAATGLTISSNSTAASANSQKLMKISLTGANANSNNSTSALEVENLHTGTTSTNYGIRAIATNGSTLNTGLYATASGAASNNFGIDATAQGATTNYGVSGVAGTSGATTNIGGRFTAGNASTTNTGVSVTATSGTTAVGGSFSASGATNNYSLKLVDGTQGAGKVLTSDASGNANWATPSGGGVLYYQYPLYEPNDSTIGSKAGRTVNSQYTDVGNVTTGEDNLMTYTVPAGTLSQDGDYLEFTMSFTLATANLKTVVIYFGASPLTVYINTATAVFTARGIITRKGATSQVWSISVDGPQPYYDMVITSETLSGSIILKATGEAVATNDILMRQMTVKYFPTN